MDEATSNLDSITEKAINNTMNDFMKDKTAIIIAHRLSTIRNCDNIYVLEKGKVIENGNHNELIDGVTWASYSMISLSAFGIIGN